MEQNAKEILIKTDENTIINGTISVKTDSGESPVMYINASLNAENFGSNMNVTVYNKDLYKENSEEIKEKFNEFKTLVAKRADALGYIVF